MIQHNGLYLPVKALDDYIFIIYFGDLECVIRDPIYK